jgi:flavin-dependent dehydrogenase
MFDGGWWWFIPFKGDVTSIGVVFEKDYTKARRGMSAEQLFLDALAEQREIKKILSGAERVRPIDTTGNWSYRANAYYGDRWLLVGDAAAFIDPLFSTGVLMAMAGGKFAAEAIDQALAAGDFTAPRFAAYQERAIAGADLFKKLVHEFYGENLRRLLLASGQNPTMCAIITSLLAGDVYRKAMWQAAVRQGFSRLVDLKEIPGARPRSSRQVSPSGSA